MTAAQSWLNISSDHIRLRLYIQPGAKKTGVAGEHGDALKIRLAAPPVEGKANLALMAWLADAFSVPQRAVTLISGEKNRHKLIEISGAFSAPQVLTALGLV